MLFRMTIEVNGWSVWPQDGTERASPAAVNHAAVNHVSRPAKFLF
jgi:hypothetical protein